jgi:hypothetical protein
MKQVIPPNTPSINTVEFENVRPENVYIARNRDGNGSFWILKFENNLHGNTGWIFRYIDARCGIYGHWPTIKEAIEKSFNIADVFEFKTHMEAFKWIFSQTA